MRRLGDSDGVIDEALSEVALQLILAFRNINIKLDERSPSYAEIFVLGFVLVLLTVIGPRSDSL